MKLSLCLAVYNEEKNIHYALDSAYDIADEVIIVDGGSEDKTIEIAKSYGPKVKIIQTDNPVMFHINKQKAIDAAKGEWILQLDADEALSEELKKEITDLINSKSETLNSKSQNSIAYWIPRKNWFLTRFLLKGGQYPDYTIRLYKNGAAKFPCKDVHENVELVDSNNQRVTTNDKRHNVGHLNNPILHYADPDFSRYLMRWNRYTTAEIQNSKFKIQNKNKNLVFMFVEYFIWKPIATFFMMYFRHKGCMDGFPGFVFALFSALRFYVIYIKWWARRNK